MSVVPESSTVKRALSAHAAIGLLAGALLYLVSLTGTLAVFHQEWQRIEQSDAPTVTAIEPAAVQRAIEAVLAREEKPTTHLYVHMPVDALPRATVTTDHGAVHVDAAGAIVEPEEIAWSDFLVDLHYTLNLPSLIGITIVGVLGVMMLALALSGVIAHPRIFRDAFRLRARAAGGVGLADWHNRLSVWTLPFTIAIALTGALIGLASVTGYGIAGVGYGGDIEKVYSPIFGEEGAPNAAPAKAPNVVAALTYMKQHHPDLTLSYVILHDPETVGQHIQMVATYERRLIFGEYFNFDAQGRLIGVAGMADGDLGQQAAASNYNLHFGNFGGLPVKLAYLLFGMALTGICATGSYIWLGKRERRGIHEPRLRALWDAVVWGSPLILALTFILRKLIGNDLPLEALFWGGTLLLLALAWFLPARHKLAGIFKYMLVLACLVITGFAVAAII